MEGEVRKGTNKSELSWFLNSSLSDHHLSGWLCWPSVPSLWAYSLWGYNVNSLNYPRSTLLFTNFPENVPAPPFHIFQFWQIGYNSRATCCWGPQWQGIISSALGKIKHPWYAEPGEAITHIFHSASCHVPPVPSNPSWHKS